MSFIKPEIEAIEASLKPVGQYAMQAGIMNKAFADCSKDEILGLLATVIKTFRTEFANAIGEEVPF